MAVLSRQIALFTTVHAGQKRYNQYIAMLL